MINLKFIEKSPEHPLGQIHCKVDFSAGWLLDKSEFPLRFTIWEEGKIKWSTELEPDWFATWDPLQLEDCEARVTTKQGKLLKSFQPPLDATHTFLYEWASRNQGAKGIVIGTNDGTHGEWVKPLQSGQLIADLVEGSREAAFECKKNWPDMQVQNCIVTTDGQQVSWYEFGTGEANTIDYDHALKHAGHEDVVGTMKETVGIRELMQADDYRWMHLDLEGIDDEIIMAMDFEQHSKPELIIFETINISPERLNGDASRLQRISEWLRQHGYKFYYDYWNSFAFLTK